MELFLTAFYDLSFQKVGHQTTKKCNLSVSCWWGSIKLNIGDCLGPLKGIIIILAQEWLPDSRSPNLMDAIVA